MPKLASYSNSGTMATSGLSAAEDLPTSPNRNWRESAHIVTDYSRRIGEFQRSTNNTATEDHHIGFVAGVEVSKTSVIDSGLVASNTPASLTDTSNIVGLQKWAGQIHSVESGLFTAELLPLDHDGPALFADFDLRLLAPDERKAKPGAIVYLTTRMIQGDSGHVEAVTNVRLRHPRHWSRAELNEVKQRGRDRAKSFAKYASRGTTRT